MVILKRNQRVVSRMKVNPGALGTITEVIVNGNRALYTVLWDSGRSSKHGNRGLCPADGVGAAQTPRKRSRVARNSISNAAADEESSGHSSDGEVSASGSSSSETVSSMSMSDAAR